MADFPWGEIIGVAVAIIGAVAGLLTRFDKRLDRLESEFKLLEYRLREMEQACRDADIKLEKAIANLTGYLVKNSGFQPRATRSDGTPWPTDDTPTLGYPRN